MHGMHVGTMCAAGMAETTNVPRFVQSTPYVRTYEQRSYFISCTNQTRPPVGSVQRNFPRETPITAHQLATWSPQGEGKKSRSFERHVPLRRGSCRNRAGLWGSSMSRFSGRTTSLIQHHSDTHTFLMTKTPHDARGVEIRNGLSRGRRCNRGRTGE